MISYFLVKKKQKPKYFGFFPKNELHLKVHYPYFLLKKNIVGENLTKFKQHS